MTKITVEDSPEWFSERPGALERYKKQQDESQKRKRWREIKHDAKRAQVAWDQYQLLEKEKRKAAHDKELAKIRQRGRLKKAL